MSPAWHAGCGGTLMQENRREDRLPPPAGSNEQQREELVRDPYDANPRDPLEPGVTSTKTPIERDEASTVNPHPTSQSGET